MATEWICDNCGKREPGRSNGQYWFKPSEWYERSDKDGIQTACSRSCIAKISETTGKTGCVLPI